MAKKIQGHAQSPSNDPLLQAMAKWVKSVPDEIRRYHEEPMRAAFRSGFEIGYVEALTTLKRARDLESRARKRNP